MPTRLYNALIRTHHITSRKKVAVLKESVTKKNLVNYLLIRYGTPPGVMYAEGTSEAGVREWVATVRRLRYKDMSVVRKPALVEVDPASGETEIESKRGIFEEVESLGEVTQRMKDRGLERWWIEGMGLKPKEDVINTG